MSGLTYPQIELLEQAKINGAILISHEDVERRADAMALEAAGLVTLDVRATQTWMTAITSTPPRDWRTTEGQFDK